MSLGKSLLNNTVCMSKNGLFVTFRSLKKSERGEVFLGESFSFKGYGWIIIGLSALNSGTVD